MVEEAIRRIDAIIEELKRLKQALMQGVMDKPAEGFEKFWKLYPKKQDYGSAEEAWRQNVRSEDVPKILSALEHASWPENERYIPWPSRWLKGKRWLDQPTKDHHGKYRKVSESV